MKEIKATADIANATAIDLGPLTMLCVQYLSAAPGSVTPADGTILAEPVKW